MRSMTEGLSSSINSTFQTPITEILMQIPVIGVSAYYLI